MVREKKEERGVFSLPTMAISKERTIASDIVMKVRVKWGKL